MKTYLLLLFLLPVGFAFSQVTITQADMPSSGESFETDNAGPVAGLDITTTGANVTWDFSSLTLTPADTINFQSVGSTPLAYQFYFNNVILYPNHKADVAQAVDDFPIPPQSPVTITNVVNYYKRNSSEYTQTGFGANISGLPSSVRYIPTDKIYELPLSFNDSFSGPFAWDFSVPTIGFYGQNKTRTSVVDGWGTLQLPYGNSFPCLRIKQTITGIDTVFIDALGFGFAFPSTQNQYKWLSPGYINPVLQINTTETFGNETPNSAVTLHLPPPSMVHQGFTPLAGLRFQNPASSVATIELSTLSGEPVSIQLFDATGRLVVSQSENSVQPGENRFTLDLNGLPNGFYSLSVQQGTNRGQGKMLIAQ